MTRGRAAVIAKAAPGAALLVRRAHVFGAGKRNRSAADLRHHLAPRRGQDDADREAAAVRRRHSPRRQREGPARQALRDLRLDGDREGARHLRHLLGAAVQLRRARGEPARHAGPPGLLRRHLPHAVGRRLRGDAHRRRQGRGAADHQAFQGLQAARHPHLHLRQQARPLWADAAGPHGRAGEGAGHARVPHELAHRLRARVPRGVRPAHPTGARLRRGGAPR